MRDRLMSLLGTAGLVIAFAIVTIHAQIAMAGGAPAPACMPTGCIVLADSTCETYPFQTGVCTPTPPGTFCTGCQGVKAGGCACNQP